VLQSTAVLLFCNKIVNWFIAAAPSNEHQIPFQKNPLTLPTWLWLVKIWVNVGVMKYVTDWGYTTSEWVVTLTGKGCGRKCLSPNLMYYIWICLEWLSKTQSEPSVFRPAFKTGNCPLQVRSVSVSTKLFGCKSWSSWLIRIQTVIPAPACKCANPSCSFLHYLRVLYQFMYFTLIHSSTYFICSSVLYIHGEYRTKNEMRAVKFVLLCSGIH